MQHLIKREFSYIPALTVMEQKKFTKNGRVGLIIHAIMISNMERFSISRPVSL